MVRGRLLVVCLAGMAATALAAENEVALSVQAPATLKQGDVAALFVKVQAHNSGPVIVGRFGDKILRFVQVPKRPSHFRSIIAAGRYAPLGERTLHVHAFDQHRLQATKQRTVRIIKKRWPQEHITVPKKYAQPRQEVRDRIRRESSKLGSALRSHDEKVFWNHQFVRPVRGKVTSVFGTQRVQNKRPRSPHGGTDLRAAVGTRVKSSNHGVVILSADYYIPGSVIIVDHGLGLLTLYAHLSKRMVEVGDRVKAGQVVGLSGKSGRVNAPHLHWGASWHNERIDPMQLLKLW